ncbi:DUF6113 family protein [Agromyces marinus]|uniref:Histidinol dehydrogenase n=1 Tax=Agromyces marinus TaxID=1389020 RepID=A0ABM8H548_9MICO|nr:DUF6113 family protein [Agromyces marinus]UIP59082.1 hypothetical protein DSM26151_19770 [Agromyces marinus]BDZ55932.1 hypothetical protein GCM10025870_30050 [Agromyces marinus]
MSDRGHERSVGARIGTLAVAFLVGALYGTIGTIGHRHSWRIGEVEIPWGLVAALVGVAALLIGIRTVAGGRGASIAAAAGVIASVGLLTLPGPGGSILVVDGLVGTIWAVAPALIAVVVVAFPSLPTRGSSRA